MTKRAFELQLILNSEMDFRIDRKCEAGHLVIVDFPMNLSFTFRLQRSLPSADLADGELADAGLPCMGEDAVQSLIQTR